MQTCTNQGIHDKYNARTKLQDRSPIIYRYDNYLSKFSARLCKLSEPILKLSKERVPFNWGPEHREAFDAIKKELVKVPILAYYDPNKEMVLQTDTSIKGLGMCLLQNGKPVYFASKALTETQ